MCLGSSSYVSSAPKAPAGAGLTVADVDADEGKSKYTKVYEGDKDVTSEVEKDTATNRYRKRSTFSGNAAIDNYAGA